MGFKPIGYKEDVPPCCSQESAAEASLTMGYTIQCDGCGRVWIYSFSMREGAYWDSMTPERARELGFK